MRNRIIKINFNQKKEDLIKFKKKIKSTKLIKQ